MPQRHTYLHAPGGVQRLQRAQLAHLLVRPPFHRIAGVAVAPPHVRRTLVLGAQLLQLVARLGPVRFRLAHGRIDVLRRLRVTGVDQRAGGGAQVLQQRLAFGQIDVQRLGRAEMWWSIRVYGFLNGSDKTRRARAEAHPVNCARACVFVSADVSPPTVELKLNVFPSEHCDDTSAAAKAAAVRRLTTDSTRRPTAIACML